MPLRQKSENDLVDHVTLANDSLFHITLECLHFFIHRIDTFE